jgi:2-desacetyl-2-hydroxyethyl bacteriochlorophyllide A dehydrogenase
MRSSGVWFTAPGVVEIRHLELPGLEPDQVLVQSQISGISAGTEMLLYRGQIPQSAPEAYDSLSSGLAYPLQYGYASVGRIAVAGKSVGPDWLGRTVFAFHSHATCFESGVSDLLPVPEDVRAEDAVFLPNMETAVNLVQDAAPILGERVLILGQGIVGLLTTSLLHEFPLSALITADRYELRRRSSESVGASASLDPGAPDFQEAALRRAGAPAGFDLVIELSGDPSALNSAIALTRFSGRVIVGSWYGQKQAQIDLGSGFHRSRIRLISSQVSTIAPELSSRWDKARRFEVVWNALRRLRPSRWITHTFPLDEAPRAYQLLDQNPENALQVIFSHKPDAH